MSFDFLNSEWSSHFLHCSSAPSLLVRSNLSHVLSYVLVLFGGRFVSKGLTRYLRTPYGDLRRVVMGGGLTVAVQAEEHRTCDSHRALPDLSICVIIQILCYELATWHYKFQFVVSNVSTLS